MKKAFVPSRGKFRRVHDVPRGPAVLHTSDEWHQRAASFRFENWFLFFVSLGASVYAIYICLGALLGMPLNLSLLNATVYLVTYISMMYFMEVYQSNREVIRQNHTGLFTYGLQMRGAGTYMFFFVPYIDILDFRVKQGWLFQSLELYIRGMEKPFKIENMPLILGEDGLLELRRRIDGMVDVPKMVVYGDRLPVEVPVTTLAIKETHVPVYSTRIQF